ncbi:hypothetical protein MKW98_013299, partial [Papaver atlanticum]
VVGLLKTVTNIQVLQRSGGQSSRIHEITIENLKGSTMKIALWGSAANQVGNDPIDCDSTPCPVLVSVCSTFVKNYQGKQYLSCSAKWDPSCQAANVLICNATATNVLIESRWNYLGCHRCSKKVLGDNGDLWCAKCEVKVEMPITIKGISNDVDGPHTKKARLDETIEMEDDKAEVAE